MPSEIYTNGYDDPVLAFMQRRRLSTHGRILEPLLRPGLHLLDLGCGPGNMTQEIAEQVAPQGSVIGVDRNGSQFPRAHAAAQHLPVRFQEMDAYALAFPDNTFDGIFSHALLEHLARPLAVLAEARRVLKPGGFIAVRSPDWGGIVLHPSSEDLPAAFAARLELQSRNGGNVHAGRHLGDWLRQAGFTDVRHTASYEIYEDNAIIVDHLATQMEVDGQPRHAATWRAWGQQPNALFAQAWFEAIGYKPNSP